MKITQLTVFRSVVVDFVLVICCSFIGCNDTPGCAGYNKTYPCRQMIFAGNLYLDNWIIVCFHPLLDVSFSPSLLYSVYVPCYKFSVMQIVECLPLRIFCLFFLLSVQFLFCFIFVICDPFTHILIRKNCIFSVPNYKS